MHVYNAKVRLGGELGNEVAKRGLTAPEILILNKIHGTNGAGGVVEIVHAGVLENYDDEEERERLTDQYDVGLNALHESQKTSIKGMFSEYGPLPLKFSAYAGPLSDKTWEEIENAQESLPFTSPNSLSAVDERRARREARRAQKAVGDAVQGGAETKIIEPTKAANKGNNGQFQSKKATNSADAIRDSL